MKKAYYQLININNEIDTFRFPDLISARKEAKKIERNYNMFLVSKDRLIVEIVKTKIQSNKKEISYFSINPNREETINSKTVKEFLRVNSFVEIKAIFEKTNSTKLDAYSEGVYQTLKYISPSNQKEILTLIICENAAK